jgi:hypothetical protein
VLRVNGKEHGFVLSFGTAVNYLRLYYAMEKQGTVHAASLLVRLIFSALAGTHLARAVFQATQADIECDGEPIPFRQFTFFFAATGRPDRARLPPDVPRHRKRGYMHLLGRPDSGDAPHPARAPLYRGFPTGEPMLFDNLGRRATIRFFRPEAYMLDGRHPPAGGAARRGRRMSVTLIRA